jgi:hypothetical protein
MSEFFKGFLIVTVAVGQDRPYMNPNIWSDFREKNFKYLNRKKIFEFAKLSRRVPKNLFLTSLLFKIVPKLFP